MQVQVRSQLAMDGADWGVTWDWGGTPVPRLASAAQPRLAPPPARRARCAQGSQEPLPAPPVRVVGMGGVGVDYLAAVASFPRPDDKLRTEALEVQVSSHTDRSGSARSLIHMRTVAPAQQLRRQRRQQTHCADGVWLGLQPGIDTPWWG